MQVRASGFNFRCPKYRRSLAETKKCLKWPVLLCVFANVLRQEFDCSFCARITFTSEAWIKALLLRQTGHRQKVIRHTYCKKKPKGHVQAERCESSQRHFHRSSCWCSQGRALVCRRRPLHVNLKDSLLLDRFFSLAGARIGVHVCFDFPIPENNWHFCCYSRVYRELHWHSPMKFVPSWVQKCSTFAFSFV